MMFIDAFLTAAKSSLASCAVSLQTASTSTSASSLDVAAEPLDLVPTASTSSLASLPKKKARHALLKQLPLSNSSKFNSLPNLGKAKGKNRMLERVKDGLRSDKARSRRRNSLSFPAIPSTSPSQADIDVSSKEQGLQSSENSDRTAATAFPCVDNSNVAMQDEKVDFAPSTRARCGSISISSPKPLRASKRRPLPTPPSAPSIPSSFITPSPAANPSIPGTQNENETSGWIDAPVSPPHFHSFVRHQADVYHTLINLSSATLSSSKNPGGYISYLRPILSDHATMEEALKVAEKQLMARLYFWLILRGAKAWIVPLDFKVPAPSLEPSSSSATPATPPGLLEQIQLEDDDAMCVDMAAPSTLSSVPPPPKTSQQPARPQSKPKPILIGDGAFPTFSHLAGYLFHIRNQPRRRERGTPRPSSPSSSSSKGRWAPTTSSPLRRSVYPPSTSSCNLSDSEVVTDHRLSSIAEPEEPDKRDWFSSLDGMNAAEDEMDEDDREWARLRYQMAMDIQQTSWSGVDPDFERNHEELPPRPASPAPESPPRHISTASELLQACFESTSPPRSRLASELDKRPLPDSDSDSDSETSPNESSGPTWKRRRLSETDRTVENRTMEIVLDDTSLKESNRAQMLRPARRLGSSSGLRKPRSRGGVMGGSSSAL